MIAYLNNRKQSKMPLIITENDISNWDDKTGQEYHFPAKYRNLIIPGTEAIYYKGKITDSKFIEMRLTSEPHYFGTAIIGRIKEAPKKNEFIAELVDYKPFSEPIPLKKGGVYYETIPSNKIKNYWRDGVRVISDADYISILFNSLPGRKPLIEQEFQTAYYEGKKRIKYGTVYERNPKLRDAALKIHGFDCKVCGINFERIYGEVGKDFIHVHHIKPISSSGERSVNPTTDLIPVCPNCHSMIHRKIKSVLGIEELRKMSNESKKK